MRMGAQQEKALPLHGENKSLLAFTDKGVREGGKLLKT